MVNKTYALIIKVFSYCDSFIVIKNFGFKFQLEIYFFNYFYSLTKTFNNGPWNKKHI